MNAIDLRRRMAMMLGFNPNSPETWPAQIIDGLISLEAREGREVLLQEIHRMMSGGAK